MFYLNSKVDEWKKKSIFFFNILLSDHNFLNTVLKQNVILLATTCVPKYMYVTEFCVDVFPWLINLVKLNQHSLLFYTIIQFQIISLVVLIQSLHWTVKRLVLNEYIKLESGHHRLKLIGTKFSNHYARCKSRKKVIVNRRTYICQSFVVGKGRHWTFVFG